MVQYHVTLNAQGYVLDLDRYVKRIREPFAGKQSAGAVAVSDLRGPEQVSVISDWGGGEGYVQHDPAQPSRWRAGSGLDVATVPGGVRLGPSSSFDLQGAAHSSLRGLCTYAGKLYVGSDNSAVYSWNGTSWAFETTLGGASPIACMEVFLGKLYVGNESNGKLASYDGTTWTATATTAGGPIWTMATHYRQGAQYLYLGCSGAGTGGTGRAYYWDGAVLSGGQYDFEEPRPYASFVLEQRLYWVAGDPTSARRGLYSVDDSGSGGTWRLHRRVAGSGYGISAAVVGGVAYIGDALSGRIWRWDGSALSVVRELASVGTAYAGQLWGLASWRGALWVAVQEGGALSLLRYDGVGWSRPVAGLVGTDGRSMAVYADQLFLATSQTSLARVHRMNPATFAASGTLESGLMAFGLPGVSKLLRSVTMVCAPLASPQSIQVEYRLEDTGSWVSLGTLSTVGATTATFSFPAATTCRQVALRLTLAGSAGASSSPTLYEVAIRYVPRPALTREWELGVVLEGTAELPLVTLDGAAEPLTGAQLSSALWTAAGAAGPVTLVDLDGASYPVYVQDVREEIGKISQRRAYQRLGVVRLVEAA